MLEEAQIEALVRLLKESVVEEVIGEQDENWFKESIIYEKQEDKSQVESAGKA